MCRDSNRLDRSIRYMNRQPQDPHHADDHSPVSKLAQGRSLVYLYGRECFAESLNYEGRRTTQTATLRCFQVRQAKEIRMMATPILTAQPHAQPLKQEPPWHSLLSPLALA